MKTKLAIVILLLMMTVLVACAGENQTQPATQIPTKEPTPTATPTQEVTPTLTPVPTPTPTQLPEEERIVTISGSTYFERFGYTSIKRFMEKNRKYEATFQGVGSSYGVKNANEGVTQIGAISRELREDEKAYGMTELLIGYDVIYILTHLDNPVNCLSVDELRKIYLGEIKNWKDVGGDDAEILVYVKEYDSSIRGAFEEILNIVDRVGEQGAENVKVHQLNATIIHTIERYPNAIGYIGSYQLLSYIDCHSGELDEITIMKIEGYKPDYENILTGDYILVRPFYYVYHQSNLTIAAQEYLDFVVSEQGQEIAYDRGLVTIEVEE